MYVETFGDDKTFIQRVVQVCQSSSTDVSLFLSYSITCFEDPAQRILTISEGINYTQKETISYTSNLSLTRG